jgi:MFS family permease
MIGYGLLFWMPSFLVRSFGLTLLSASRSFGAIVLIGGIGGIWLGGSLADRYGAKRRAAYALVPAIAFVATVPFYVTGVLCTTYWMSLVVMLVPTALGLVWLGPALSAVQHVVPATMRATASAIFLFVVNLIGIGLGTTLIGALSDAMRVRFGAESLRYAMLSGTGCYLVAALCFALASRGLENDWHR